MCICPQVWCGLYRGPQLHDPWWGHPSEPRVLFITQRWQRSRAARQSAGKKKEAKLCVCVWDALQSLICRNLWCWTKKAPTRSWATSEFTFPLSISHVRTFSGVIMHGGQEWCTSFQVWNAVEFSAFYPATPHSCQCQDWLSEELQGEMEKCKRLVQEIMSEWVSECDESNSFLFREILIRAVVDFPHLPWKQANVTVVNDLLTMVPEPVDI